MTIRIVIADDEIITRVDIKERLESKGYEVVGEVGEGINFEGKRPGGLGLDLIETIIRDSLKGKLIIESNDFGTKVCFDFKISEELTKQSQSNLSIATIKL